MSNLDDLIATAGRDLRSISWHSDGRVIAKSSAGAKHPRKLYTGKTPEQAVEKLLDENFGRPVITEELLMSNNNSGKVEELIATYLEGLHNPSDDSLYNDLRADRDTKALKGAIEKLISSKVNEARIELFNLFGTPQCENLHHPKKYQHKGTEDCPVVDRIRTLKEQS